MSGGLQLLIGEDGSQIIYDTNTGKRYALLEKKYPAGNINYQFPTQNSDYRQDINTVPMQQMNQHKYSSTKSQTIHTTEAQIHQQNYKPTTPKQNQTRTTQHTTTQQNTLLHNHPQYVLL
jgi:hypothetical protein